MYNNVLSSDHHSQSLPLPFDDHHRQESNESLSFRHFHHQPTPSPRYFHNPFDCENNTYTYGSATPLSPDSSPLRVPLSPESHWSFSSPPRTPPIFHHQPLLYQCTFSLRHHDGNIHSIALARGLIFTSSSSPSIRAWQSLNCTDMGFIRSSSGEVRAMLAHGNMLFTSHKDYKIRVWTISSSPTPSTISNNNNKTCNCDVNDRRLILPKKIATFPKPNPLRFLLSKPSSQHKDIISCMAFNQADGLLYSGSHDKTVKAWSLHDKKCVDTFAAHSDNINNMVINEEGYLFTCSSDGTLKMWSKVCGETFHTLTMTLHFHPFPIYALALTPVSITESSLLYSGSADGCIFFWEQQMSGEYTRRGCIQGHQFGVLCLAIVEDMVVSGSADGTIKIWRRIRCRARVGHECVGVLEGHKGPVKCVVACLEEDCFVRGFLVFSSGLDRSFRAWKVKVLSEGKGGDNNQLFDCRSIDEYDDGE